jgi:hypothetical protein
MKEEIINRNCVTSKRKHEIKYEKGIDKAFFLLY